MMKQLISLAMVLALGACSAHSQYSSGADYLARQNLSPSNTSALQDQLIAAASVEPTLRFPSRIGLARIANGRLTAIPNEEAALWRDALVRNPAYGEFVPVSPLVAQMTRAAVDNQPQKRGYGSADTIQTIRLGAARQHFDAVLVYEVGARGSTDTTMLGFADLTVIGGAFLPTRSIEASAVASALLIDVLSGYPYGTAEAQEQLQELSTSWGSQLRRQRMTQEVGLTAVGALIPEVERMFGQLTVNIAASRHAALQNPNSHP